MTTFTSGESASRMFPGGSTYYYFADQLGSVRRITNSTGTICFNADYASYGKAMYTPTNSCPTQPYEFAGYARDTELAGDGLDFANARYYNYRQGRFMSADPLGGSPLYPQILNRYPYVANNPINGTDPSGTLCKKGYSCWGDGWNDANGGGGGADGGGVGIGDDPEGLWAANAMNLAFPDGWGWDWSSDGSYINIPGGFGIDPTNGLPEAISYALLLPAFPNVGAPNIGSVGQGDGSFSWWGAFAKNLFLSKNLFDEFKSGGCGQVFLDAAGNFLGKLAPLPSGSDYPDVIKSFANGLAFNYAATQLLSVPMRSSVYRSILSSGETLAAEIVAIPGDAALSYGLYAEYQSYEAGQCR